MMSAARIAAFGWPTVRSARSRARIPMFILM
jgi:hypothetical protein